MHGEWLLRGKAAACTQCEQERPVYSARGVTLGCAHVSARYTPFRRIDEGCMPLPLAAECVRRLAAFILNFAYIIRVAGETVDKAH